LAVWAVVLRLRLLAALPDPLFNSDSPSYFRPALRAFLGSGFDLEARRPPGYPALLYALFQLGGGFRSVLLAQHALGLLTGAAAAWLYYRAIRPRAPEALLVGFLSACLPKSLLFSHTIMTESLSAFLFAASLAALFECTQERRAASWLALGALTAAAALVHPSALPLLILIPAAAAFLAADRRGLRRRVVLCLAAAALPLSLASAWRLAHDGWFGLQRFSGRSLFGTAARLLEPGDVGDPSIRRALEPYFGKERLADANWVRYGADGPATAVAAASGLGEAALDDELLVLSRSAVLAHPMRFAGELASEAGAFFLEGSRAWPMDDKSDDALASLRRFGLSTQDMPAARTLLRFREPEAAAYEAQVRGTSAYPYDWTLPSLPLFPFFFRLPWLPCAALLGSLALLAGAGRRRAVAVLWLALLSQLAVSIVGGGGEYLRHSMPLDPVYLALAAGGLASLPELLSGAGRRRQPRRAPAGAGKARRASV
jgi:4-amino-4-deoxy-L-arabinose transferase-like glycosyltransferase